MRRSSSTKPIMAETDYPPNPCLEPSQKYILLLGEGNFSFAAKISKAEPLPPPPSPNSNDSGVSSPSSDSKQENSISTPPSQYPKLLATDFKFVFHNPTQKPKNNELIDQNISKINKNGGRVFLDVDATKIHIHPILLHYSSQVSMIIFNFPHVQRKKMHIGKNRGLLQNFFVSTSHFLLNSNQPPEQVDVCVTLCAGQSGVDQVESKKRLWADTWQIVEMATTGGFILKGTESFEEFRARLSGGSEEEMSGDGTNYECTGFRNGVKGFHIKDGNTFIFRYRRRPTFFSVEEEMEKLGISDEEENLQEKELFYSLEEQLTLKIDAMESMLQNVPESHPLHDVLKKFNATPVNNLRLRTNFRHDDYFEFEFVSGVEIWIEGVQGENMYQKLVTCFFPKDDLTNTYPKLEDEDDIIPRLEDTRSITVKGAVIGTVHSFGNKDHESWDLNLSKLLSMKTKNKNADWRVLFSEYCQYQTHDDQPDFFYAKFTTGSCYPRKHSCDVSFWTTNHNCCTKANTEDQQDLEVLNPVSQMLLKVRKIALKVYGTLLKSIQLLEEYSDNKKENCCRCHQEFQKVSYCFRIKIQSLDRPLSREVAGFFQSKFKDDVQQFLDSVELR